MKEHQVTGGGGVKLHVVETGNEAGRPILFIHGFSQSGRAWGRQMESDLAKDHRLVTMDLRGHGGSDKPFDAYGDSKLWADDVNAVIRALGLKRPVLTGWSYGPVVILDYARHYGEDAIGGMQFVGGVSKLGSDAALAMITPAFLELVPGFFSEEAAEGRRSLEALLRLCMPRDLSAADLGRLLDENLRTPAHVRRGLFSRTLDNDDLLRSLRGPVLLTSGADDAVVKTSVVEAHKALVPHAQVDLVPGAPHGVFWTDAPAFNGRLRAFCTGLDIMSRNA
jgi:pimeloyl-ACP methyl ester carboxylesterase